MRLRAWLFIVGMVLAVVAASGAMVACGGTRTAKFAEVKAGDMPEGQGWTGVYYNPVYGYLHMVEQGDNIVGKWKRTDSSHWGELSGTVEGNVMHYTWKEHQYGTVGAAGVSSGSGIFVYKMGSSKIAELDGQYALDDSESVGQWHCVKQNNVKPDPDSISGDNPADVPAAQDRWQ